MKPIKRAARGFTVIERTLIEDGKTEDVERMRRSFQRTMRRPKRVY